LPPLPSAIVFRHSTLTLNSAHTDAECTGPVGRGFVEWPIGLVGAGRPRPPAAEVAVPAVGSEERCFFVGGGSTGPSVTRERVHATLHRRGQPRPA
jgi:hypothetical protein